jgi:ribosome biogenesis GTPase
VGKSTLVNALIPTAERVTGHVNAVTGRGRHTSTSVVALHLPGGGLLIDTPGIRSFGLAHVDVSRVIRAFPDLEALTEHCPRACSHDEPDCALNDLSGAEGDAEALAVRVDSLRRMVRSRTASVEEDEPKG